MNTWKPWTQRSSRAASNGVDNDEHSTFNRLARPKRERLHSEPVIVLPGFGAGPRTMYPLRVELQRHGLHVEDWGLGVNRAALDIEHTLDDLGGSWTFDPLERYRGEAGVPLLCDRMTRRTRERAAALGSRVTLVGWSLGGTIAREVARDAPDVVARVITLGSPVVGGPKYTAAAAALAKRGLDLDWIERQVARREERPIQVPVTAIVSPSDAIVGLGAAFDRHNGLSRHVLLDVAHLGMGINPKVWAEIIRAIRTDAETSRHANAA